MFIIHFHRQLRTSRQSAMQHAGYVLRRPLVAIFNLISDHDDVRSLFSVNHFTLTQPTLSTSRKEIVQEEWGKSILYAESIWKITFYFFISKYSRRWNRRCKALLSSMSRWTGESSFLICQACWDPARPKVWMLCQGHHSWTGSSPQGTEGTEDSGTSRLGQATPLSSCWTCLSEQIQRWSTSFLKSY